MARSESSAGDDHAAGVMCHVTGTDKPPAGHCDCHCRRAARGPGPRFGAAAVAVADWPGRHRRPCIPGPEPGAADAGPGPPQAAPSHWQYFNGPAAAAVAVAAITLRGRHGAQPCPARAACQIRVMIS
jgi:hypothetical protein